MNGKLCAFFDPRYKSRCNRDESDAVHHQPFSVRQASYGMERYYDHAFVPPHCSICRDKGYYEDTKGEMVRCPRGLHVRVSA